MANKLDVMIELESRGALPPEKAAILNELRDRGVVPKNANESGSSFSEMMPSLPSIPQEIPLTGKPIKEDLGNFSSPATAAGLGFTDAYTAGIAPKLGRGLESVVSTGMNRVLDMPGKSGDLRSVVPGASESVTDEIARRFKDTGAVSKQIASENPLSNLAGELGGFLMPTGVVGHGVKATETAMSKLPFLAKLFAKSPVAKTIATSLPTNLIASQTMADLDTSAEDRGSKALIDSALSAAVPIGVKGLTKIPELPGKAASFLSRLMGRGSDKKAKAAEAFAEDIGNFKTSQGADVATSGDKLEKARAASEASNMSEFADVKDPIISQHGNERVDVSNVVDTMQNELWSLGVLDSKNRIDQNAVELFDAPVIQKIINRIENLKNNPTLRQLDELRKSFGKKARFNKMDRDEVDTLFGSLYNSARESVDSGIESIITRKSLETPAAKTLMSDRQALAQKAAALAEKAKDPLKGKPVIARPTVQQARAEIAAKQDAVRAESKGKFGELVDIGDQGKQKAATTVEDFRAARQKFSGNKTVLDELMGLTGGGGKVKASEKIVAGVKNNLPGTRLIRAIEARPELTDPIREAVAAHIASRATSPKSLESILGDKGFGKAALTKLFGAATVSDLERIAQGKAPPGFLEKTVQKIRAAGVPPVGAIMGSRIYDQNQ